MLESTKQKIREYNFGKKYSKETKLKIKLAMQGRKVTWAKKGFVLSEERKKQISEKLKGHTFSIETLQKMRDAKLGKKFSEEHKNSMRKSAKRGIENHMWNGGITTDNTKIRRNAEYKCWQLEVYKKNSYKCCKCGNNHKLNAHHIINFADNILLRYDVNNGITLCKQCHNQFHKLYGKLQNSLEQINIFLNN